MLNQKIKTYTTEIGSFTKVSIDPASKARVISFPFEFPDGTDGVVIVCKLAPLDWKPSKDIRNITINFKDEDTTTKK